jgi:hypothetical protein
MTADIYVASRWPSFSSHVLASLTLPPSEDNRTFATTGLRLSELASITPSQVCLDGPAPHVKLRASDEKNRRGSSLPLRNDLASDLRAWIAERPDDTCADEPIFQVPAGLVRVFDRDLAVAGIAKKDVEGRSLDIHALRTTFATHLSLSGVSPRTAQAALRHSDIRLTMGTYTDPQLLDIAGAVEMLPSVGTSDGVPTARPPLRPPQAVHCSHLEGFSDNEAKDGEEGGIEERLAVSPYTDKGKQPLPTSDNGCHIERLDPDSNRGWRICNPLP